jgi:hypothetical protein
MPRQVIEHPGKAAARVVEIKPGQAGAAFAHGDQIPLKKSKLHCQFSLNRYPAILACHPMP